jgi:predicted ATPase
MLARFEVQHYKSLYDVKVDLEPLTVFIGPNGSGKSNICESLAVLSKLLGIINTADNCYPIDAINLAVREVNSNADHASKFWHGVADYFSWGITSKGLKEVKEVKEALLIASTVATKPELSITLRYRENNLLVAIATDSQQSQTTYETRAYLETFNYLGMPLASALSAVKVYDFSPTNLSSNLPTPNMTRSGDGLAASLVDILHSNRDGFDELEDRFRRLVPNMQRIVLPRSSNPNLGFIDKFSSHEIPVSDISDGTLRILAFLTAIYQENTPSILCFEEIENGVHPWLLHKMMELLKIVSTEGVTGKPVQIIITTHSPVLLNYVEPHQVRAVELDAEGKTQIHALPTETARFQKAMEAYDGALGELWFTGIFGGNPA